MRKIQIRYNYSNVVISEEGVVATGRKTLCANTVAVKMKDDIKRFRFNGFRDYIRDQLFKPQLVKVLDVVAILEGDSDFPNTTWLPKHDYCVGEYDQQGVFILLKDGVPITV